MLSIGSIDQLKASQSYLRGIRQSLSLQGRRAAWGNWWASIVEFGSGVSSEKSLQSWTNLPSMLSIITLGVNKTIEVLVRIYRHAQAAKERKEDSGDLAMGLLQLQPPRHDHLDRKLSVLRGEQVCIMSGVESAQITLHGQQQELAVHSSQPESSHHHAINTPSLRYIAIWSGTAKHVLRVSPRYNNADISANGTRDLGCLEDCKNMSCSSAFFEGSGKESFLHGVGAAFITYALARRYMWNRARRKHCTTSHRNFGLEYSIAATTVLCDWVERYNGTARRGQKGAGESTFGYSETTEGQFKSRGAPETSCPKKLKNLEEKPRNKVKRVGRRTKRRDLGYQ
ncbi:hypothetical protein NA56DRAFT_713649 [Hyaloscypha hepaticicola]|uniref:Uncharacterized protein n=1 Tax=Hyaloscypha hepaticicola TaxID=2082293 RepID=A0A2J6PD71_9HELO|nr:hypothetical protein NA56DRAFT_713649 [Hyaloscypha hepaticicola]